MKNSDVVRNYNNLYEIIHKNDKYPVKLSFAITKNLKILEQPARDFEEAKGKLLDAYGIKNIDGTYQREKNGEYVIRENCKTKWKTDMMELLDIDVKVEPQMVTAEDFPTDIEPGVILALEFMTESEA